MDNKTKFNKLDRFMHEEYDKTVEEIEAGLSKDGSFDPDRVDSEALRVRIHKQIEAYEEEKKKIKREKRKKWRVAERVAIFLIVTAVGIFCASMVSEANRIRLGDKIRYLTGNEVIVQIGGEGGKGSMASDEEEILAYQDIKEKIGIPIPIIRYKPDIKKTITYDISHEDAVAMIEYQYGDTILRLCAVNKNKTEVSGMVLHGKRIKEVEVMGGFLIVPVQKIKDKSDIKSSFSAQWEYQEGYYQLSGKINEKEFIELVENIRY